MSQSSKLQRRNQASDTDSRAFSSVSRASFHFCSLICRRARDLYTFARSNNSLGCSIGVSMRVVSSMGELSWMPVMIARLIPRTSRNGSKSSSSILSPTGLSRRTASRNWSAEPQYVTCLHIQYTADKNPMKTRRSFASPLLAAVSADEALRSECTVKSIVNIGKAPTLPCLTKATGKAQRKPFFFNSVNVSLSKVIMAVRFCLYRISEASLWICLLVRRMAGCNP